MSLTEMLGYAASVIVAVSFVVGDVRLLRVFNSIGAVGFVIYGLLIGSYPVALLNGFIVIVNLYHIIKLLREKS